ncbi:MULTISPECIES: hypothetical protein [Cupriavidus]|uniref:hypothetical protein n=1 Tax=Cupriavidus TaxID=106589 RepID=UPI0020A63393|nr:hypothetical protein [Cupriavidus basilensis]MCP3023783.1 hypothetical protein [Cupriavidus basilensis]
MVNTYLKKFRLKPHQIVVLTVLAVFSASAAAQSASGGMQAFCFLINYFKQIVGAIAVLAIFLWVIGYFNKQAHLSELGQYIFLGCVIAVAAYTLVAATGLIPPACSI